MEKRAEKDLGIRDDRGIRANGRATIRGTNCPGAGVTEQVRDGGHTGSGRKCDWGRDRPNMVSTGGEVRSLLPRTRAVSHRMDGISSRDQTAADDIVKRAVVRGK